MLRENITIIIPVYNTEKYLKRCLNSILTQTYKSYKIICVNDGSTDNSLKLLEEYKKNYPDKIQIINQPHQGPAQARNLGMHNANGDYILFVDSDDFIDNNLLYELNNKLKTSPDIVIFGVKTFYENKKRTRHGQYSSKLFKNKFSKNNLFNFHSICVNKLYKRNFLIENDIYFSNLNTGEDQSFFIKAAILGENIEIIKKDLYNYRKLRKNSLTYNHIKNDLSPIKNYYIIEEFLTINKVQYKLQLKILSKYLLKAISWYGKTDMANAENYYKELNQLINHIQNSKGKYWWDYYKLKHTNSYLIQKLEILKSLILYFIFEKLIFIPAMIFFFFYFSIPGDE